MLIVHIPFISLCRMQTHSYTHIAYIVHTIPASYANSNHIILIQTHRFEISAFNVNAQTFVVCTPQTDTKKKHSQTHILYRAFVQWNPAIHPSDSNFRIL